MWVSSLHVCHHTDCSMPAVMKENEYYVLLTVHLGIIFVNDQLGASSGELLVSIRHLVYLTLYR